MNESTDFDPAAWNSPYHPAVQIIGWIVASLLSLETIIGNAMVIIAYKLERSISKQVSNRYIVSLAISDLIIGIEGIPLFTVYVINGDRWPLGSIACETWLFLDYTLCLVSILTVLLITADRYLSVCHTAKYLKWQSPTKTQILIVLSWIIPAVIFGVMIYGWAFIVGVEDESELGSMNGECFAPFLSNPYVNMGMYIAYYWTTLVAMLILYKGIHQAAKNLEKKAKAKEHRHIALLLTQRLGTQVGVSLMLHSKRAESLKRKQQQQQGQADEPKKDTTESAKDSGYHTNNLGVGSDGTETLEVTRETRSLSFCGDPLVQSTPLEKEPNKKKKHRSLRITRSAHTTNCIMDEEIGPLDTHQKYMDPLLYDIDSAIDSLSTIFRDDSLSSVLQFKKHPPITAQSSPDRSDSSSVLMSKKLSSRLNSNGSSIANSLRRKISRRQSSSLIQYDAVVLAEENGHAFCEIPRTPPERGGWLSSFRKKISRWIDSNPRRSDDGQRPRKRSIFTRARSLSTSSSDESSAEDKSPLGPNRRPMPKISEQSLTVPNVPTVKIIRENQHKTSNELTIPSPVEDARPSSGHHVVTRKISTLSSITRDTTERIMNTIFTPVNLFNKGRKRTKAERRAHKAFRTITFIVGLFAILWSPYYVVATIYGFCKGECIPAFLYNLSYYMCYLNSSGNPFAYALANRQFRTAFLRMFRGNFKSHS